MKLILSLAAALLAAGAIGLNAADAGLALKIQAVKAERAEKGGKRSVYEAKLLELLQKDASPEDKGQIYSAIAYLYAEHGFLDNSEAETEAKYCEKALDYPQPALVSAEIYGYWADVLYQLEIKPAVYPVLKEKDFAKARKKSVKLYLAGLKAVLDALAPQPAAEKDKQAVQAAPAADPDLRNKLNYQKESLISNCVNLYLMLPYRNDELRGEAEDILTKKYDAVAKAVYSEVERRTSGQAGRK
jgi:hypothetical protein